MSDRLRASRSLKSGRFEERKLLGTLGKNAENLTRSLVMAMSLFHATIQFNRKRSASTHRAQVTSIQLAEFTSEKEGAGFELELRHS